MALDVMIVLGTKVYLKYSKNTYELDSLIDFRVEGIWQARVSLNSRSNLGYAEYEVLFGIQAHSGLPYSLYPKVDEGHVACYKHAQLLSTSTQTTMSSSTTNM